MWLDDLEVARVHAWDLKSVRKQSMKARYKHKRVVVTVSATRPAEGKKSLPDKEQERPIKERRAIEFIIINKILYTFKGARTTTYQ